MTEPRQFFIVGAQRSGTTYLYSVLDEHPEIEMASPSRPEPKFFLEPGSQSRAKEYLAKYFKRSDARARGEKSTSYIESEEAAERIHSAFPDAGIIFLLRNPVYRAISNYWFSVKNKIENREIEVLMDEESQNRSFGDISVSPFRYLQRGRYAEFIDRYRKYFREENIKILIFEDFANNSDAVNNLYNWLDTSEFSPPSLGERINQGSYENHETEPRILRFLYDYYLPLNKDLAEKYRIDVSVWEPQTSLV